MHEAAPHPPLQYLRQVRAEDGPSLPLGGELRRLAKLEAFFALTLLHVSRLHIHHRNICQQRPYVHA